MMRVLMLILILFSQACNAYNWRDLFFTPNQQAQKLMQAGQYAEAKQRFENKDWAGAAAYRDKDYKLSATSFQNAQSFYNEGNALAHLGKYEQAIKAYDKVLAVKPNDADTIFNRKLVEDLLKKNPQDNKDKQQQDKDKQDQEQQNQDQKNQDQQDKRDQEQKDPKNPKQQQDPQDQKNKQDQDEEQAKKEQSKPQSQEDKEKQQAKEQWMRLIPDDPGGLLREKFLRDHLRRERG